MNAVGNICRKGVQVSFTSHVGLALIFRLPPPVYAGLHIDSLIGTETSALVLRQPSAGTDLRIVNIGEVVPHVYVRSVDKPDDANAEKIEFWLKQFSGAIANAIQQLAEMRKTAKAAKSDPAGNAWDDPANKKLAKLMGILCDTGSCLLGVGVERKYTVKGVGNLLASPLSVESRGQAAIENATEIVRRFKQPS